MNRIKDLFDNKQGAVLSIYFTAGFPALDETMDIIKTLSDSKVDMIEIGIPFSDPVADGPVIQGSNEAALQNGMTLRILLQQLEDVRQHTVIPLVLMGHINPIMQYGEEQFLSDAKRCGIDGVIIPDLPPAEYEKRYRTLFEKYGLKMIFLITPQTTVERIRHIDSVSDSFIYMVTSAATTGGREKFKGEQYSYFKSVAALNLDNPVIAGFGIHDKQGFDDVCRFADGAIVGSGFIKVLAENKGDLKANIQQFIQTIRS